MVNAFQGEDWGGSYVLLNLWPGVYTSLLGNKDKMKGSNPFWVLGAKNLGLLLWPVPKPPGYLAKTLESNPPLLGFCSATILGLVPRYACMALYIFLALFQPLVHAYISLLHMQ